MLFKHFIPDLVFFSNNLHLSGKAFLSTVYHDYGSATRALMRSETDVRWGGRVYRWCSRSLVELRAGLCAGHAHSSISILVHLVFTDFVLYIRALSWAQYFQWRSIIMIQDINESYTHVCFHLCGNSYSRKSGAHIPLVISFMLNNESCSQCHSEHSVFPLVPGYVFLVNGHG